MFLSPGNLPDFMGCFLLNNGDQLGHSSCIKEEEISGPTGCFTKESLVCFYEDICILSRKVKGSLGAMF